MDIKVLRPEFKNEIYNVLDFGAKAIPGFNNKVAIQAAIDKCSLNGGGMVLIPDGYYLTGPIEIKSNVNLHVSTNAFVQFTKSKEEYPLIWTDFEGLKRIRCLSPITAKNANNIAITGKGIIDGNGELWRGIKKWKVNPKYWDKLLKKSEYVLDGKEEIWCPTKTYYDGVIKGEPDYNDPNALKIAEENWDVYRPVFLSIESCDKVLIEDVTLQNSPAWNVHPFFCTNLSIINANIKNKFHAQNGDGLDLESCKNCEIAYTTFEVGDDGICIKSGKNKEARKIKAPTENVWIHDCKVFNAHGGFVVGSEMSRGVKNILVENCLFVGTDIGIRFKSAIPRGGVVEDITIRNIAMSGIEEEAMIFTMGYVLISIEDTNEGSQAKTDPADVPEFKNIYIDNIVCDSAKVALKVNGLPELPIHDIYITNSKICANKEFDLKLCENIKLNNVEIIVNDNKKIYNNEVLKA